MSDIFPSLYMSAGNAGTTFSKRLMNNDNKHRGITIEELFRNMSAKTLKSGKEVGTIINLSDPINPNAELSHPPFTVGDDMTVTPFDAIKDNTKEDDRLLDRSNGHITVHTHPFGTTHPSAPDMFGEVESILALFDGDASPRVGSAIIMQSVVNGEFHAFVHFLMPTRKTVIAMQEEMPNDPAFNEIEELYKDIKSLENIPKYIGNNSRAVREIKHRLVTSPYFEEDVVNLTDEIVLNIEESEVKDLADVVLDTDPDLSDTEVDTTGRR